MIRFNWLRNFIRRYTSPIPEVKAYQRKKVLSLAYFFLCWNAGGLVLYLIYHGKSDWAQYHGLKTETEAAMSPAQSWAKTLSIDKARIIRVSGLSIKNVYEIDEKASVDDQQEGTVQNSDKLSA